MVCNFRGNLYTIRNICAKYEQPLSKNERGFRVTSHKTDNKYLTLIFDPKVTSVQRKPCCNLYNMGNYCAKYVHPRSKHEREYTLQAVLQILRKFDLDL